MDVKRTQVALGSGVATVALLAGAALLPVAPAGAAGQFDGTYKGKQTTVLTNNSADCAHLDHDTTISVRENHFNRTWGQGQLSVDVAPDGTFAQKVVTSDSRRLRDIAIKGRITGNSLEADIGTNLCAAHLSLTKS